MDLLKRAQQALQAVDPQLSSDLSEAMKQATEARRSIDGAVSDAVHQTFGSLREELRSQLMLAVEDGAVGKAAATWQQIKDLPLVRELMGRYSGDLAAAAQRALLAHVSESSLRHARSALDVATNVALHARDAGAARGESPEDVMRAITSRVCALHAAAADAWGGGAWLRALTPEYYVGYVDRALAVQAAPRLVLPGAAAVLHGHDVRRDEFVAALIVAYSGGAVAEDAAANMVSFFEQVVAKTNGGGTGGNAQRRERQMNDVVSRLLDAGGPGGCERIGGDAWALFDVVDRDLPARGPGAPPPPCLEVERWGWRERAALAGLRVAALGAEAPRAALIAGAALAVLAPVVTTTLFVRWCLRRRSAAAARGRKWPAHAASASPKKCR